SFFLRDLFLKKVFIERGLVTRAANTRTLRLRRRVLVMGAGFASIVLLLLLTWYGAVQLDRSIRGQTLFWTRAASDLGESWWVVSSGASHGRLDENLAMGSDPEKLGDFFVDATKSLSEPVHIHWILRPA